MFGIKEKESPLKKMITLTNPNLINTLIKIKASESGQTEGEVIESCIADEFLNKNNENVRYAVQSELTTGGFSVPKICDDIFCYYAAMPGEANDTLLPLIQFLLNLELKSPTSVGKKIDVLPHLMDQLDSIIKYLEEHANKDYPVQLFDQFGVRYVDQSDVVDLKRLYEHLEKCPEIVGRNREFVLVFLHIQKYWACGNYTKGLATFKNWTRIYRLMADVCRLADWKCTAEEAVEFLNITKKITNSSNEIVLNSDAPMLEKFIEIKGRTLLTTKDAIILKSEASKDSKSFAFAREIIHGYGNGGTKVPYILLFNEKDYEHLDEIKKREVSKYPEEFPNPDEPLAVNLVVGCVYHDPRVIWYTM